MGVVDIPKSPLAGIEDGIEIADWMSQVRIRSWSPLIRLATRWPVLPWGVRGRDAIEARNRAMIERLGVVAS